MSLYKLLSGYHGRFEDGVKKRYHPGDMLELSDEQAARFGAGRLQPYTEPAPAPVVEDVTEVEDTTYDTVRAAEISELLSEPAGDVVALLEAIDDIDHLRAIEAAESTGKARKTVLQAVQARLMLLEES